jgi:hypothetical protein
MMTINNNTIGKGGNIMLSTDKCGSIPQVSIDQLNGYRSLFVGLEKLGLSSDQVAALAYERYNTCARVLREHLVLLEDFVNAGKRLHANDERINAFFVEHTKLALDLLHKWEVPHQIMKIGGCSILALGEKLHPHLLFELDTNQLEDTKKEEVKPMETKVDIVALCESCGRKSHSKMLQEDIDMMDKLGHVLRSKNGTIIVLTDGCPDCEPF